MVNTGFINSYLNDNSAPFKRNKGKGGLAAVEKALDDEVQRYQATRVLAQELVAELKQHHPRMKHPGSIRLTPITTPVKRLKEPTDFGRNIRRYALRWDHNPRTEDAHVVSLVKALMEAKPQFLQMASEFPINGLQIMGDFELRRLKINARFKLHIGTVSMLMEQIEVLHFIRFQR